MGQTRIEWATHVWNPATGCSPVSEGCENCYARRMATRFRGRFGYPEDEPFRVTLHPERLNEPLRWRKPRKVFVCSMGDLFHPDVPFSFIAQVFDVMCSWRWPNRAAEQEGDASLLEDPGHTFIILTKRPERMLLWLDWVENYWPGDSPLNVNLDCGHFGKHIWIGVTAENQDRADERIPVLLQIPAAVRFVSVEPILGPVDLNKACWGLGKPRPPIEVQARQIQQHPLGVIDWVICGSETGPNRRPANVEWIRNLRDQCVVAGVPFFLKQMEVDGKIVKMPELDGRTWDEFPNMEVCLNEN